MSEDRPERALPDPTLPDPTLPDPTLRDSTLPGLVLERAVLTGSAAEPWPVTGCRCPSCTAARGGGRWSRGSGLLLPGCLVVDGDPRDGVLDGLPRLATADRPGARRPAVGERVAAGDLRVVALPAGTSSGQVDPSRVVLVLGAAGRTLLWAPDTGPLPQATLDALHGAGLLAAVLDTRAGDPPAAAHQVARLRAADALAPGARLVAAGLPHDGPPVTRYAATARAWGVEVLGDGTPLLDDPGRSPTRPAHPGPRTVVLGAASSGKSLVAESLLAAEPAVVYLATGAAPDGDDPDWAARVRAHQLRRPDWWRTVEGADLAELLRQPGPPLLVDSLGSWLTTTLTRAGCWQARPGWREHLAEDTDRLLLAWRQAARRVVAVVEEVGWGVVPATASGGHFRDALGTLGRRVAEQSEQVLLVVAGQPLDLDRLGEASPPSVTATAWEERIR